MPHAKIHLFASLRKHVDGAASVDVEIEPGDTFEAVLHRLGIPPEQTRILFRNNRHATLSDPVEDGDQLSAFPGIGGG